MSDAVYQEVLLGRPAETTLDQYDALGIVKPDITIFVDLVSRQAYERILSRGTNRRFYEEASTLDEIARAYQRVFASHDPRVGRVVRFVNDSPDVERQVSAEIVPILRDAMTSSWGRGYPPVVQ